MTRERKDSRITWHGLPSLPQAWLYCGTRWLSWHLTWKHTCLPAGCSGPSGLGLVMIQSFQFCGSIPLWPDLSWGRIKAEQSCIPFPHHSTQPSEPLWAHGRRISIGTGDLADSRVPATFAPMHPFLRLCIGCHLSLYSPKP